MLAGKPDESVPTSSLCSAPTAPWTWCAMFSGSSRDSFPFRKVLGMEKRALEFTTPAIDDLHSPLMISCRFFSVSVNCWSISVFNSKDSSSVVDGDESKLVLAWGRPGVVAIEVLLTSSCWWSACDDASSLKRQNESLNVRKISYGCCCWHLLVQAWIWLGSIGTTSLWWAFFVGFASGIRLRSLLLSTFSIWRSMIAASFVPVISLWWTRYNAWRASDGACNGCIRTALMEICLWWIGMWLKLRSAAWRMSRTLELNVALRASAKRCWSVCEKLNVLLTGFRETLIDGNEFEVKMSAVFPSLSNEPSGF